MLELQNVSKWFGGLPALQDVSFQIPRGRVTALIGPNGAGKSTLINCISGVDNAQTGASCWATVPSKNCRPMKLPHWALPAPFRT
jgi:ABC-type branched-subunit amino acid transport system ATPase component